MYCYRVYGLNISSSRKIALLDEANFRQPDLRVEWHVSDERAPDRIFPWQAVSTELLEQLRDVSFWTCEVGAEKFFKVVFKVNEVRDLSFILDEKQTNLSVYHAEHESESDLDSYFAGPVMSFVLRMRGIVSLHASAVAIDGKAVAFAGHSTAGKSTIAAGMSDAGAEILADDITVLTETESGFFVPPGYRRVRLRPVAAQFLTASPETLPMVYSHRQSRYVSTENGGRFHAEPLPLAAIYILGTISDEYREPFILPVSAQERLISLVRNASGPYVVMKERRATEFEKLTRIAKTVPVRRLHYAHDIETLPRQCRLILEDVRRLNAAPV